MDFDDTMTAFDPERVNGVSPESMTEFAKEQANVTPLDFSADAGLTLHPEGYDGEEALNDMKRREARTALNERMETLGKYALYGHNAEWDAQNAALKENRGMNHLVMDELSDDDRDFLLGAELTDTLAKGDTWGAAERMAELMPAESREAYLTELRGCEKETDMFRLMGRTFRADTRGKFDRQQAWAEKNDMLAKRWAAGDDFDDSFTEADVDAMIMPMPDADYENMTRVREFMRDYVRPLEKLDDYEEAMRRLDGMEDSLIELVGDDEGSKDRADIVTQTLLGWAQKMAKTNRANEWNEVEVAVGKMLSNWMRFQEQSVLQQLSTSNYLPMGAPSMPVLVEVSDNTKQWAAERNANRDQRDKARGTLRLAVDEAMKAESAPWYRKMTRGTASMFGETLPYLLPNGMLLGTTNLMTGGAYEQYTKNLAQGMESGEAFVNAYETQGLNATVEALPWNRAISRIGGTGLNATFGRFLSEDIKKGIKPGWVTRKVAAWSSKNIWRAAAAETLGSFVDEGVLEPLAQGFLQYGTDHALDMLGVKHGETKGFWEDFDELKQTWTDPTQLGALMLFSAALTGAYTPQIKKQVEYFAENRNFWITQGLTEKQADEVVTSDNPWEEGRKVVNEEWEKDADGMRQRRLDNTRKFAGQGGVLVLTGAGSSDPDLNPGGMVDRAAAAVWQDYVDRGILPQVERTSPGMVRLTRKDGSTLELTDEKADVYLLQALNMASIEETRKLQEMMGGKAEAVNLRQEIANSISTIAGRAGRRAVEQTSDKTGVEYADVLEGLPSEIKAKIEVAGGITYAIAEEISQYALGQIDEMVAGGASLDAARNSVGQMGRMRSLGTWADFARDFAARAKAGNLDLQRARTTINRSSTRYRTIDGKHVMGQVLMGNGGTVNHYGILEDLTESFADQMLDERAQALQAEQAGMSYGDARAQALKELHGIVKAARDAVLKADPKARIENMGETPNYTEVVEALSTMALSQFALGNAVPAWMRGLSSALAANLQMAADVNMVRAAYANALKTSPDALAKMEQLLDKLGVQVRDVMREAQITEADIQAWKNSAGVAQVRADGPMGSGGASVTNVVADAEQEEQDIAEREKQEPVQESEPTTGQDLQDDFERHAEPLPEDTVPENMRGVFTGGCVFNAAGGYFVGLIDKTKLRDGTEQVKKGTKGKHGVIAGRELTGNFQASAAPLYVWKRKNGELQVISGRHRFELMMRDESCTAHLCYVFEENEEHNETWARMTDYENNMRDDQADELTAATYVRETGYSDEVLRQKGLLRNASRSKRGALIGREARQDLWNRFNSGAVDAKDAEIICNLTKNIRDAARIEDIQARCCQLLEQKKSWEYIGAMVQLMANKEAVVMRQGLLDLGADFEADLNRAATWIEKNLAKINEAITLLKQGRKMSEKKRKEAERLGISVATTEGTQEMLQLLNDMKSRFEFIGSYPDMVAQASLYDGESEVDPVGQMLEQAQRDRAEMAEENAMSDDELLEKRNREIAAQSVPTLFQMDGRKLPDDIQTFVNQLKELADLRDAHLNNWKMGDVLYPVGNASHGASHVFRRRDEQGFSIEETARIAVLVGYAAQKGEPYQDEHSKPGNLLADYLGIRAIIGTRAQNIVLSGYAFLNNRERKAAKKKERADVRDDAPYPHQDYTKLSLDSRPEWVAALGEAIAWFENIVKTYPNDFENVFENYVETLRIKHVSNVSGTFMKAPNGAPTNLTERQWLQVRTKAFKKWFGDWENDPANASKLLDENREPREVYHGTATDGLTVFSHKKAQDKQGRKLALGWGKGKFYLTTSEIGARAAADGAAWQGYGSSPQVMKLFVNVRKPMSEDEYAARYAALSGHDLNEPYADGYGMQERDKYIAALDKNIRKEGYDGIVDAVSGAVAVFAPNQIKSATDNRGTFDGENADITFSMDSNLAAAHTLSVDKFLAVAKLGGMPVPRLGQPGPGNRIYLHDAYTGTMPQFFNKKKNTKKLDKLVQEKIKPALASYGMDSHSSLRNSLFRNDNNENVVERSDAQVQNNEALAAYWAITEKGYTPKPKMKVLETSYAATWNRYDAATKRKLNAWAKSVQKELTDADIRKFCAIMRDWFTAHPLKLAGAQQKILNRYADAEVYLDDFTQYSTVESARAWYGAISRGETKAKRVPDVIENARMFRDYEEKNRAEFGEWAKKFQTEYVGDSFFKTRRQKTNRYGEVVDEWWELTPATLTNLTRYMRQEKARGGEQMSMTPGLFLALMSAEMKGKRDVAWNRDRIVSSGEFKAINDEYEEQFSKFYDAVYNARKYKGYYSDEAQTSLYRVAELRESGKSMSDANIAAAIRSNTSVEWTDELVQQGVELVQMALTMPSDYMEAIPMRAVKLDEFRYAIMPESLRDNAEVNAVIEDSFMDPIYHDGTREGYEKAMAGLIGSSVSFQMTDAALGALDILRGRENEVEGTRLITAWQEMVNAWSGKDVNKLGGGYRAMAEMRSLIAATRAVLPEKYARMGNLRMLLQWAEVYSTMADEGKVPMSGAITNPIFEQVRQRMAEQDELNRLNGLTDEEAADVLRKVGGMRMEHLMRKVAFDCRTRLERWLKDQERERIETMIERMYPKREPGKKSPRGKMDADTYRQVEKAHKLFDMDANEVADIIDANKALLAALKPDDADYEERQAQYENEIYMASLYGNWFGMSLDDARRAVTELVQLMTEGRTAWEKKLQEERNHTRWLMKSISKNFKVSTAQTQVVGADKQMDEGAKKGTMLKKMVVGNMSLSHMLIMLRPVLGKEFCDRHRRMLAEHHKNTLRFNNELRAWMFDTLSRITGLKTEDEMQVWMNNLNQRENTGIRRKVKVTHSVALPIEEARRWVEMSKEEREAERKRIAEENEAKEQLDTDIPLEEHILPLKAAIMRYEMGAKYAAMSEEEREETWRKEREGKSKEWIRRNNPGLLMSISANQRFVKAESSVTEERDEIVATKEGILYTLLLLEQDDYAHLAEPNGLTEENVNALRDYVGKDVMAWGYAMRDKLIEQGKDLRTFYEAYTGVPLASNPRYFPGAFKMEATRNASEAPDQQAGAGGGITGGKMGCLIARRKHNRQFDWLISASSSFWSAMQQQFNYVSVTPMTREWKNLLNNSEFSRRLEAEVGPEVVNKLTSWVEMLDGAQLQDGRIAGLLARFLRPVLGFYALSRLAGNVYTWAKQSSGIIHGFIGGYVPDKAILNGKLNERMTYHHIGFGEYIGAFAKCLARQNVITLEEIKDSDYIKQRAQGKGRYLEEVLRMKPLTKVAGKTGRWAKQNITDRSMDVMENIDRNANAVSMLALVNAIYDRAMVENADGMVPEEAIKKMAIETAGIMIDEVAQPKLRTQKSHWAASNALGGVAGDFIMLFKSESLNKLSVAFAQGMSGEGAAALAGYAAFGSFNALVLWAINWVRGQWSFGDDDKSKTEWWQKLAKFGFNTFTADLSALPIVGEAVGRMESSLFGGYSPQNSLLDSVFPATGFYNAAKREVKAIDKGDAAWDQHLQNVTNMTREAAACGAYIPSVHGTGVTISNLLAAVATVANMVRAGKDVVKKTLELAQ